MKNLPLFLLFFTLFLGENTCNGQGGTWVWVNGSDTICSEPIYGIKGIPDVHNSPGGLYNMASWTDWEGNFWLWGGMYNVKTGQNIYTISTSDLWKYEPLNNTWTWMTGPAAPNAPPVFGSKGVPNINNTPGALSWGVLCWTDKSNNLWLYAGNGPDASNALWRYSIDNNQWTWISGGNGYECIYGNLQQASEYNAPGSRAGTSAAWTDINGDLWLYGGQGGKPDQIYNDVWKFDIKASEWVWMCGPQGYNSMANYGILGVESPSNIPPPRINFSRWTDDTGNLYMYGGNVGYGKNEAVFYNDVWKFNSATHNWVWVAGDSGTRTNSLYNQYCLEGSMPAARCYSSGNQTMGCSNICYCYGGTSGVITRDILNDLWLFKPQTASWVWLSGSKFYNDFGTYGTLGMPSFTNQMPARYGFCQWVDRNGVLWIYGGIGCGTINHNSNLHCGVQTQNDLWKFIPDTSCVAIKPCSPVSTSVDIFVPNAFSPNGDGINDRFTVFGKQIEDYEIKIFNRTGQLMYLSNDRTELNDTTRGWDGNYKGHRQDAGVYIYYITGKNMAGKTFDKKGSVTLVK